MFLNYYRILNFDVIELKNPSAAFRVMIFIRRGKFSNDLIEIIKYNQFIDFVYDKKKASMGQNKREAILGPVLMKNKTLNLQNNLQNILKVFPCR